MPDVYRVVAEHRAALLRGEDSARSAVARAYQEAIAAMLRDIERAAARTDARGYELLRVLMAEMETAARHLERVAGPMAGTIARAQSAAVIAASGDAESIVRFLATAGDTPYRRWHDPQAAQNIVGALADGSPLESALRERLAGKGLFGPSVLSQAKDALTTAVLRGMGAREAARTLRPVLRSGQWVAERIARTETIRAYREASRQSYLENADVVSGWRWVAAHSARTCAACLGMDGRVFPSTVPLTSHPACFVAGTMVQSHRVMGSTERWYDGDILDIRTDSGAVLSVTPNHPILTPHGWIAAGLLHEGGDVIRSLDAQRVLSSVNPDYDDVPAAIEDVAKTLRRAGGVASAPVEVSPEDFHGDGAGSKIGVIRTDGLLGDRLNASRKKPFPHDEFVARYVALSGFSRGGDLAAMLYSVLAAPGGFMRSPGECLIHFRGAPRRHEPIGLRHAPNLHAEFMESPPYHDSLDSVGLSQLVLGLSRDVSGRDFVSGQWVSGGTGQSAIAQRGVKTIPPDCRDTDALLGAFARHVQRDRIINVSRRSFRGHVYNLQTATGWYIANGIITHNCRCVSVPVVIGAEHLTTDRPTGEQWLQQQDADTQEEVLGARGRAMWASGAVGLSDFVHESYSPQWGVTRTARTPKERTAPALNLAA